ncbi:hypothetical protein L5G32_09280 [Gordonia sp. HY002]|uniref:hypothetical protein n=1 Tax=Gordonia zhenghanii TaxID=2911516 RepID=UPI001EF03D66|nr:hypothetical protein [Gordonia zhenghanii]MCF8570457.1 hypothetical protein [Gordonia zhenghanii]MCF8602587.1 hypothetical protein [Gordonia zhenghanii]
MVLVALAVGALGLFGRRASVQPPAPVRQPTDDAIALASDARRHLIERAKSRLITQLVFLPFFVVCIGFLAWLFGHPGQRVSPVTPQRWMPDVQRQLDGAISPEMSRNWAIAALALSATLCVALASRSHASSTILGQAAAGLWRQYVDGMTLLLSCSTATVAAAGWLSVSDRSDIGTMTLTTLATIAIVGLSSMPTDDSNPVWRWGQIAGLQADKAKLTSRRSTLVEKGVPTVRAGSRLSLVGNYFSRTFVIAGGVVTATAICVPLVRSAEGLPTIDASSWSLFVPVILVPLYTAYMGYGAITLWSTYRVKRWRLYFCGGVALPMIFWGSVSVGTVVAAGVERGIVFGAFLALYLVGVPAVLAVLLRLSRASLRRTSWIYRFARWLALPIWSRVHQRLDRRDRLIEADIALSYEARWHISPDEIGLA